ncbi:MAG: HAD family hydrolase [Oscillospiraceae bacterium]|nr:HAD family hydrolase [Oscillospiraceae bacterium]MBR1898658.1 HAD family hydrolase [Oscillospiraceae bacterium]
MQKPEMILFDFGHTLIGEFDFNPLRGNSAIFPYLTKKPNHITPQQFSDRMQATFSELRRISGGHLEFLEENMLRYVLSSFGMELRIPLDAASEVIWDNITDMQPMPGVKEMLARMRSEGMRTAIISNIAWSESSLRLRLARHLPEHTFEFIIATSSYLYRKPDVQIFELGARMAGLAPEQIWYVGNDVRNDVFGAHAAGMFPVYLDERRVPSSVFEANDALYPEVDFPHLRAESWDAFVQVWDTLS